VAVSKPAQVGRPARPALPAAGETSVAAAGAARQPSGVSDSRPGYKIPRLISPIREGSFENFQALPGVLDDCIIRAPEEAREDSKFKVTNQASQFQADPNFKFSSHYLSMFQFVICSSGESQLFSHSLP
jgi:hypothetical protein